MKVNPIEFHTRQIGNEVGGGKWEVVKEFQGRSHRDGGIDIEVRGGIVRHINAPHSKPDLIAKSGSWWKNIGAGLYGAGEGLLDTITFGATDPLTDAGYKALQKAGGSTESEMREQDSIRGYGNVAGAVTGGIVSGGAATGSAVQQGAKGLGAGISKGSETSELAQQIGTYLPLAGSVAGMAMGNAGYGKGIEAAKKAGEAAKTAGNLADAAKFASQAEKLTKLSKIATTAGNISQFASPAIGIAQAALTRPQTPLEGLGMMSTQLNASMPMMTRPNRELEREVSQSGKKSGQTGYANMDGYASTPAIGSGLMSEGPIQFRMPPVYQAESAQYLGRYGINS